MTDSRRLLTNSSVSAFLACERRFQLRYVVGLEPERKSAALRLGDAFHQGLDAIYTSRELGPAISRVLGLYAEGSTTAIEEEWQIERETCLALLIGWFHRYAGELGEVVASELPFDLPIRNPQTGRMTPRFRQAGKLDRIVREADGVLALVEHKTTGDTITPDSDYLLRLRVDPQISRYVLATRQLGFEVRRIVYDITRKPSIRPKQPAKADLMGLYNTGRYCGIEVSPEVTERVRADREIPELFGARLVADIAARPEFYFTRLEVARLEDDLARFDLGAWSEQQRIAQAERSGIFLRNPSACLLPHRCAFADLCFAGIEPASIVDQPPAGYRFAASLHPELGR